MQKRPVIIGLTGGIASGKSTVARHFQELGVTVIDTDVLARQAVEKESEALQKISHVFGKSVLEHDGSLDRAQLANIVFDDVSKRTQLEAILHPIVLQKLKALSEAAGGAYQVHVIPLLFETGMEKLVDIKLVVDCSESIQLARVMKRDHCGKDEAQLRLDAQISREKRLCQADQIIVNQGNMPALVPIVAKLNQYYENCGIF